MALGLQGPGAQLCPHVRLSAGTRGGRQAAMGSGLGIRVKAAQGPVEVGGRTLTQMSATRL